MGFLSDIEKSGVIQKSASRLSLPENTDSVYTLLDAINALENFMVMFLSIVSYQFFRCLAMMRMKTI